MLKSVMKRLTGLALALVMVIGLLPAMELSALAASGTLNCDIDGLTISYAGQGKASWDKDADGAAKIVMDVSGSKVVFWDTTQEMTLTITNTNETGKQGVLTFSYDGSELNGGKIEVPQTPCELTANGSVTITLTSPAGKGNTAQAKIFDISFNTNSATVTFLPAEGGGSYTVNGTEVKEEWKDGPYIAKGYSVAATPDSGMLFAGWSDDDQICSTDLSPTLYFKKDATVTAKFIPESEAILQVGDAYFNDLNTAAGAAASGNNKTVVLLKDAVLPAGDYTIPAGVTLLIPFDKENTLYTTVPGYSNAWAAPSVYRKLTMAPGATLTVADGGAISVGAKYVAAGTDPNLNGVPTGEYGQIQMEEGSSIALENGAKLYAWGYITGDGQVIANVGATVYENLQIQSFRGGTATSNMEDNKYKEKVFPLSQLYVQNIEANLTMHVGAREIVYTGIYAGRQTTAVAFDYISGSGLFQLTSGTLTKHYDPAEDRLIFDVNGNMKIGEIPLKLQALGLSVEVKSSDYVLPISGHTAFNVKSGTTTIQYDTEIHPGVRISVDAGATLEVAETAALYVYDAEEWNDAYSYKGIWPVKYSPTRTVSQNNEADSSLADATIDVNGTLTGANLYTTETGANIISSENTGLVSFTGTPAVKTLYEAKNNNVEYEEVKITSVQLKNTTPVPAENAYNEYSQTSSAAANDEFYFHDGMWDKKTAPESERYPHVPVIDEGKEGKKPTCTEPGLTAASHCEVCGLVLTEEETIEALGHQWDEGKVTTEPTCTEEGVKTYTCTVCEEIETAVININPNNHTNVVTDAAVEATCSAKGKTEGRHCEDCGKVLVEQKETEFAPHTYGEAPAWTWTEVKDEAGSVIGYTAAATFTCSVCADGADGHTKTVEAAVREDESKYKAPTCVIEGSKTYTASVTDEGKTYTCEETKTVSIRVDMENGHSWATVWSHDGKTHWYACTLGCGTKHGEADHTWGDWTVTVEANCQNKGEKTRTCTVCEEIETAVININPNNHTNVVTDAAVAATCTKTGKTEGSHCEACKAVIKAQETIKALGHAWDEGKVTTEPTCTEEGVKTYTCKRAGCNETKTEPVAIVADAHKWGEWTDSKDGKNHIRTCEYDQKHTETAAHVWDAGTVTTKPTCTEKGVQTYTCDVCKAARTEEIAAKGHDMHEVADTAKTATCTAEGKEADKKCSRCAHTETGKTIEKIPHSWDAGKVTTEPTCTEEGVKTYTCTVCGDKSKTEPVAIVADAHKWGEWTDSKDGENHIRTCEYDQKHTETVAHVWNEGKVTTEPTCYTAGSMEFTCTVCAATKTEEIPATGKHSWAEAWTTDGENHWHICTTQGCPAVSEKIAHTAGDPVRENVKGATCTVAGSYDEVVYCSVCGEKLSTTPVTGKALGHTWDEGKVTIEPTCTEKGVKTYTCTVCEATRMEEIEAKGHTWDAGTVTTKPTCTAEGVMTFTCKRAACNETKTESIKALGHDTEKHADKAATCTEKGWEAYETCTRCDYTTYKETAALGHELVNHDGQAATCTENGWEAYETCTRGDYSTYAEIPALDHDMIAEVTKAATCKEDGERTYSCTRCEETRTESIPATGHRWNADTVTKAATCTEAGERIYKCTACEETRVVSIPATGHSYQAYVTEPSCTEGGYTRYVCELCGDSYRDLTKDTAPMGHDYRPMETVEPTCTDPGYTLYRCVRCDLEYRGDPVEALGHSWDEGTVDTAATCEDAGVMHYTCTVCGEKRTEAISSQGHTPGAVEIENEHAASCMAEGSHDEVIHCTVCRAELSRETVADPMTEHSLTLVEAREANCTDHGNLEHYACDVCRKLFFIYEEETEDGETVEVIEEVTAEDVATEATGHSFVAVETVAPTCTEQGYTVYRCDRCNEESFRGDFTEPHHHWDAGVVTLAPTTSSTGVRTYTCDQCGATRMETIDRLPDSGSGGGSGFVPGPGVGTGSGGQTEIADERIPLADLPLLFEDVTAEDWFYEAVKYVYYEGMMNGVSDTRFNPQVPTSRGMIVTILYRLESEPETAMSGFTDVDEDTWYAEAVGWAAANEIVRGFSETSFGPEQEITREQLAAILYRYAVYKGYDVTKLADLSDFADAGEISAYALLPMRWAVGSGLIRGVKEDRLDPRGNAVRAQTAKILAQFHDEILPATEDED